MPNATNSVNTNNDNSANQNLPVNSANVDVNQLMSTMTALLNQNAAMINMLQRPPQSEPIRNFCVMPDLSKTIGTFTGEKGPIEAKQWLQQLETTATLHTWPEAFIFETAKSSLVGAAKHWFKGRMEEINDWDTFRTAFRRTFVYEKSQTDKWKEMCERIQGFKENTSIYFHEKVALCRRLHLQFEEVKEQVAIGLWAHELSSYILSRHHQNEDELYRDIVTYERIAKERKEKNYSSKVKRVENKTEGKDLTTGNKTISPTTSKFGELEKKEVKAPIRNEKGELKCYNCGAYGHISKYCPEEKREITCLRCGVKGHTPKHCTKPRKIENPEVNTIQSNQLNDKSSAAKYIKNVSLSDGIYTAMIDTGSSECTIKATAALMGNLTIAQWDQIPEKCDKISTHCYKLLSCFILFQKGIDLHILPK